MKLTISADLFRIAYTCASTETTRYYLNGVCIQPAPDGRGVVMVATDGHRMIVVRDETAQAHNLPAGGVIVQASKDQLRTFKTPRKTTNPGDKLTLKITASPSVTDDLRGAKLTCEMHEGETLKGTIFLQAVDGSFPDWTRIVPRPEKAGETQGTFNAQYLESFAAISGEFAKLEGASLSSMSILQDGPGNPALIRFGLAPAFGVLMPQSKQDAGGVPEWMSRRQPLRAVA